MTRIILLSAARGAGKTTAAWRAAERARATGLRIGGILAPARYDPSGHKVGIDALDLAGGETRPLAERTPDAADATIGEYTFAPEVLAWSLGIVLTALDEPLDAVWIDEIGRLELEKEAGYAPALSALYGAQAANAILLVRDRFVPDLQRRLAGLPRELVLLSAGNRDAVPAEIVRLLATG
jgi:nucleoside-triphosphatase THEP1